MKSQKRLINKLVKTKTKGSRVVTADVSGATDEESTKPDRAKRRMNQIENVLAKLVGQNLYMLEMQIIIGTKQSTKLAAEDLGLSEDLIAKLDEIEAKGGYAPRFSKLLKQSGDKLRSAEKDLYRQCTIYSTPFRFIREEHLPLALELIKAIEDQAEDLRAELVKEYATEMQEFLAKVADVVAIAYPNQPQRIEVALQRYAEEYPSPEDFEDALQVVVKGPIKLTSIADQLKEDSELQLQLAQQDLEIEETRAAQQQLETQRQSQELIAKNLGQALGQVRDNCTSEAFGIVGEIYDRLSVKSPLGFTQRDNDAWNSLSDRLQLLASHCPSLEPMAQWVRTLHELYAIESPPPGHFEKVTTEVERFREFLMGQISNSDISGKGTKKLVKSLEFNNEFRELREELEYLKNHPDPKRLKQLKGHFTSTLDQLKFRQNTLAKLYRQAEKEAETRKSISSAPGDSFDADAGF